VVLCFFYLKDGPKFVPWASGLAGPRAAPHVAAVAERGWTTLSGFIRAQSLVGLVDAVFIGIGLAVLGVPLALPLAVLVFFGGFIPIVGAFVTGALAALVALVANGFTTALIVVGLVVLVQQLEGNVLQPVLMGRTLDLHPAVVILAVTAGGATAGITGAFLAVPVVAVVTVGVRYARQQLAEQVPGPGAPVAAGQPTGPPEVPEADRDDHR
jgi:putative heme transporter